jgi:hypothetical protein
MVSEPKFVTVTYMGFDVVPNGTDPKSSSMGVTLSFTGGDVVVAMVVLVVLAGTPGWL